jgi:hypothetical protein
MFNLIASAYFILLSTDLNEYVNSFSWTGEIVAQLIPAKRLKKEQSPVTSTPEISKAQETVNIPVALPVNATVWLKEGSATTGQVNGFDAKQQSLTLGEEPIKLAQIKKVVFGKTLAYDSDGKIVIRGDDTAKAKQSIWSVLLSAFQLNDPKRGKAQVDLAGTIKPLELRGIQSIAKNSDYVLDELEFQPTGKMTIKVTPTDR